MRRPRSPRLRLGLKASGARRLVYKPVPHIYHVAPAEEDLYALHAAGAVLIRREVSAAVPPGGHAGYTEERRRALARAERAGIVVGEDDQIEEYMLFSATSYGTGMAPTLCTARPRWTFWPPLPRKHPPVHGQARRRAAGRRSRLRDGPELHTRST